MMTVDVIEKEKCTGCGACVCVCVHRAISMEPDQEGFLYPVIDREKCTDCGLCLLKCPLSKAKPENRTEPEAFACYSRDRETQLGSTSGGLFTELAKAVLSDGGAAIGARYTENFAVEHAAIFSEQDIPLLRQSKYLQSDTQRIYAQVQEWLKKGLPVLFCGTPCQNAALRCFLRKEYDNLIRCDFICRGVASPKVFRKYLDMLESDYRAPVQSVQFKNKDAGWHNFGTRITFQNGGVYYGGRFQDPFMTGYLERNLFLRPSCHQCPFHCLQEGDITLGDFWGIEKIHPELDTDKGTSAVILNTSKGRAAFERIKPRLIWANCGTDEIRAENFCMERAAKAGRNRRKFFEEIDRRPFRELAKQYASPSKFHGFPPRSFLSGIKKVLRGTQE
ncbi:Coenzyme F420 hydrogenase/dehydrogenase, beta subunit C-terminal domain [Caproicibacter sp.]|uniref:Coenzyme F420 hydrogenase/dehydrogenase, beta subunit C-terminal domain n=1 Tax=Caproicibacter sp. TaxID=2814884 RepID=UPI00398911C7